MEKKSPSKEMAEPEKETPSQVEEEEEEEEEEEFVLLDLDGIADHIPLPDNTPYVLSVSPNACHQTLQTPKIKFAGSR